MRCGAVANGAVALAALERAAFPLRGVVGFLSRLQAVANALVTAAAADARQQRDVGGLHACGLHAALAVPRAGPVHGGGAG